MRKLKQYFVLLLLLSSSVAAADVTEQKVDSIFKATDPFKADLSTMQNVGSVMSDDGKLRIVSWNNRSENGTFEYYNYFIYKKRSKDKPTVKKFTAKNAALPKNKGKYNANNWYGCLYYKAVAVKGGYMLLGYQTYRDISRVKIIEPLNINGERFTLGDDVFEKAASGKKKESRAVFEYSNNAVMNISYEPKEKRFVFDHLSPENPNLKGMFQYYGPDFTYDALTLKKKRWTLTEDIDIKNKE
ncbi:MAG: hypothetical protein II620_05110 [Paludibacteraceae bacterium]|nr:hypothetical protein [Paludibacteraceae bacterium]